MESIEDLWQEVLNMISLKLSKPSFDTWFKSTEVKQLLQDTLIIQVPNDFTKEWLDSRYKGIIEELLLEITGSPIRIHLVTPEHIEELDSPRVHKEKPKLETQPLTTHNDSYRNLLNAKYTFETFVVGTGNRFAHAASLAVAEAPAKSYNPLFLYGGVGLGKTHLMHAIGHFILDVEPNTKVLYISSEKFTNEFITAIRDNNAEEFRNRYRNVDILLIDDIQFLAGKEQTQEEFFHTFNALHEENKQIIISSDRPPREIPTLEDRLRSRFEWGLITDIQPPDLETRIAILQKKAKAENLEIPDEVMAYIANQFNTNIRELEGALIRIVAYSSLVNRDMDAALAQEALKDIISSPKPRVVTTFDIQKIVSNYYGLKVEDLKGKRRVRSIVIPRQIAMYLSRELTDLSLPKIGEDFGGKDHTTVMHAHQKISQMLDTEVEIKEEIEELKKRINTFI